MTQWDYCKLSSSRIYIPSSWFLFLGDGDENMFVAGSGFNGDFSWWRTHRCSGATFVICSFLFFLSAMCISPSSEHLSRRREKLEKPLKSIFPENFPQRLLGLIKFFYDLDSCQIQAFLGPKPNVHNLDLSFEIRWSLITGERVR